MKVTRNTPDQLIISDQPWMMGLSMTATTLLFVGAGLFMLFDGDASGWLFALGGGAMGALGFALLVRRTQVIFDRPGDLVTLRQRSVFGYSERTRPLSSVERAVVENSQASDSNNHRPALVMKPGSEERRLPLVTVYTNASGPKLMVDAINGWLASLDSSTSRP